MPTLQVLIKDLDPLGETGFPPNSTVFMELASSDVSVDEAMLEVKNSILRLGLVDINVPPPV